MADTPLTPVVRHIRKLAGLPEATDTSDALLLERFAGRRDEAAFAALVRRHGPLVWRVCRRVLRQTQHAEEAYQATFLVLARQAAKVRKPAALASWLYAVAYRIARRARANLLRRQSRECQPVAVPVEDPADEAAWRELEAIVVEEVHALAEKYRAPILLCYWEGLTNEEAAVRLGWPAGTVKTRLLKARHLLHERLTRRGVSLSAGAVVTLLAAGSGDAAVPSGLAASALACGQGLPTAAASGAAALAEQAIQGAALSKVKIVLVLLLGSALAVGAGTFAYHQSAARQPEQERAAQPNPKAKAEEQSKKQQARTDHYGDPLPAAALARMGTLRFRHGGNVEQIAFSPDGKVLASACNDSAIYLWEAATGKELRHLKNATAGIDPGVAISPDGKLLVAGQQRKLRRWELATGKELPAFHVKEVFAVGKLTFSPNGKVLACSSVQHSQNILVFLDASSGKELYRLGGLKNHIKPCLAFSPNSTVWAYADKKDKDVRLFDTKTGKEIRRFEGYAKAASTVAFSPDGKTLAATDYFSSTLRFWETATGKPLPRMGQFGHAINLTYSPDGKFLAGAGYDLWDVETGKEIRRRERLEYPDGAVVFSPDGKTLACPIHHAICLWDVPTGKLFPPSRECRWEVGSIAFAPDGKTLATAGGNSGGLHFWEPATGKELRSKRIPDNVYAVAYSPDGRTLAMGVMNKPWNVGLLDAATGKVIRKLKGPSTVELLAFSADGKVLASKHRQEVLLWNTETGKELRRFAFGIGGSPFVGMALSPDGKTLADAEERTGVIHLWDASTGKVRRHLHGHQEGVFTVAFSPDGTKLASGGGDKTIRLWDAATGRELRCIQYPQGWGFSVVFSPDGRSLTSSDQDGTVRVWEVSTGGERCRFEGHRHAVRTIAFSADGTMLATAGYDTTALVWDLTGRRGAHGAAEPLSPQALEECWSDLAGEDAARAYRAEQKLAAAPAQTVASLSKRLKAVPVGDQTRLSRLIAELDSDQFAVRQKARKELQQSGEQAESALREALQGKLSLEARKRIEELLDKVKPLADSPEGLRSLRAVEVLEHLGTSEAREVLQTLANGASHARLTREAKASLERLAKRR
jgi:RNA polymerase sigma factor (sigma-70 family)